MTTNNTKQAAWIAVGSLVSFSFGIISSMILSRYFDKSDYGTYKQVMYVYNTLLTVFTLGLPRAYSYFLPRVPISQARHLIKKISKVFVALGLIFSISLYLFSDLIARLLQNSDLEVALKIFAIVPSLLLPTMGLEGILATYKRSQAMAVYTVATRLIMLVAVIVPVCVFRGGFIEAIVGFVCSSFISLLIATYLKYMPIKGEPSEECKVSLREIFSFSIPLLTASLWGMIIDSADQFFVSRYFGTEIFADFSNGNMNMPFIGMIIGATSTVLSPVFSRLSHEHVDPKTEIFPLWKSVFEKSAKLIYPLVLYCIVFADVIMVLLYGQQYKASGLFFQIRLLTNFFTIIAFAPLLINIGKVKFYSNVHMYGAIILVLLEFISVHLIDNPYAISVISALCAIGRIVVMLHMISKLFDVSLINLLPLKLVAKLIFIPTVMLLLLRFVFVKMFTFGSIITFAASIAVYGILYIIYSYIVRIDYFEMFKSLRR